MARLFPIALAMLVAVGCVPPEEAPLPTDELTVPPQVPTDITFYAFGDPQYGGGADDKNTFQVTALNAFAEAVWPADLPDAGSPIGSPLGVLIAGDLTQNGQDGRIEPLDSNEIGRFVEDYGLTGSESELTFPIYEGYGNHDFDPAEAGDWGPFDWRSAYAEDSTPSADMVAERNPDRLGLVHVADSDAGHYSWDWDWVHLVNLNLCPADEPSQAGDNSETRDPRGALDFLRRDLEATVADSGRPVILMSHYGFDGFSQEERWWTDAQKEAFFGVAQGYNVIAYLHGHTHATYEYEVEDMTVLNVGSPYYTQYNADDRGHFTVLRVTDERLVAADVAWTPEAGGADPVIDGWTVVTEF